MKRNTLPGTDLSVTQVCLGTMTWGEQNTEREAHAQLDLAIARGINFIDTAEMYPVPPRAETQGRTENFIGTWLPRQQRDKLVIAGKVAGPGRRDWLRGGRTALVKANIREACEETLRRLRTDYLDLFQIHWPGRNVPMFGQTQFDPTKEGEAASIPEQVEAMADLVKAGLIRHWGLSNETSWGVMAFARAASEMGLPRPVTLQNCYSLIARSFDGDLAETCFREKVGLLAYSPLAGGYLSGKYAGGAKPASARFALFPQFGPRYAKPNVQDAVAAYAALATSRGLSPARLALAWQKSRWAVTSTIVGATTLAQLEENIGAFDLTLDDGTLAEIEAINARFPSPAA
ncbi:MAG: aldo/keto reductase [Burkholderiales bacterium]|jgi:aryl-alcohol dehydrogenase (NADP+)|nr:aldo/keto reductase [Burkholderiales bacterium]